MEPRVELIHFESVEFGYGRAPILVGLNFSVREGAVTILVGPSGSGKSTALRLIAGFEVPRRGSISIAGRPVSRDGRILVPPEARGIGMVFQDLALWPHMTVRQTLEFVLGRAVSYGERQRLVDETLAAVGLDRQAESRPASLSGGERQRVALARAIVTRPRILLMDEPLSNLDPPLRQTLMEEIRRLQRRLGLTVLYVTHNQQETFVLGDHAAVIRAGRIEQVGTPRDLYERPGSAFVASFLGRCALVPATVRRDRIESPLGALPRSDASIPDGAEVLVVIRPEDVVVDGGGAFTGAVERAVPVGGVFETEVAGPGWRLWASLRDEWKPGSSLTFSVLKVAIVPPDIR